MSRFVLSGKGNKKRRNGRKGCRGFGFAELEEDAGADL